MKRKRILRALLIAAGSGIIIAIGTVLYVFNMPHRDVQSAKSDYTVTSAQIVGEYLTDQDEANRKYLSDDGDSKILKVTGMVSKKSEDYNGQVVLLLKEEGDKAGVSATFTSETNTNASGVEIGELVTVKGVIRSGASYDEDLELYEHVILEKSDIVNN